MVHDLIVIGGGPGGYACAVRAAQLGLRVLCIEQRSTLGGTCLNVGCIPSKALLHSSYLFSVTKHMLSRHGIRGGENLTLDLTAMMERKIQIVDGLTKGVESLFRKNKIDRLIGIGQLIGEQQVLVNGQSFKAQNIVIATGAEPISLTKVPADERHVITSTGALSLGSVPEKLVVIGAGAIGLELGSVWNRLGTQVIIVESCDYILPAMDSEVRQQMLHLLERQGIAFKLGCKVTLSEYSEGNVTLQVESISGACVTEKLVTDVVLVSIGRRPCTNGLNLETVGVACDARGAIIVDNGFCTNVHGIYAIGDVIGGLMLAHKAEEEGLAVAERIAGYSRYVNYNAIPTVIYTWPEIASVGETEEDLQEIGLSYKVGKFPFSVNARSRCNDDRDGFVKILADTRTDKILGAHIIGYGAGELIAELTLGIEFSASAEDIAHTSHAHPSFSEAIREAALVLGDGSIHL